ncbi:MAG: septum formation initiator family protein [Acetivibrio sp.]
MASHEYQYREFVQGNTVRKLEYPTHIQEIEETKENQDREKQKRAHQAHQGQNWDVVSLLFMMVAIGVTLYVCVSYIQVQHNITTLSKQIAAMESEICDLKNQNDAAYNKINTSIDLSYVYRVATKELGMVRADKNQILSYSIVKSDFVRQYNEIPEKEMPKFERILTKKKK